MHPRLLFSLLFLFIFQLANAQHVNVLISTNNAPNEPSICINPLNTNEIVAAANIDNVYYSHDGGVTWTQTGVSCPWGIWGDPVIGVDTAGDFYFLHLSNPPNGSWIDRIICQKSQNAGESWSPGSYMGLNGTKAQDKHWIAVDPATNYLYVTWTQFDEYGSTNPADSSVILFSKSVNAGQSWSNPQRINKLAGDCIDSDDTAEGAVPCVGPNGEVYVAWSNRSKIWFDKSLDGGQTWLSNDILVSEQPGGWDYAVPGIYRCNGLPVSVCDLSGGPNHGTIYVNWTDQRNGASDTDVWLAKSTDGGQSWSQPVRINNDNTATQQFFTWMSIDQTNGDLWFVFYDRRNWPDSRTDVYMAVSKDGGTTFNNFKISENPFVPQENVFFGDYNNVSVHNGTVRPIWTRLDGNDLSVWTALVAPDAIVATEPEPASLLSLETPFPNPFSDKAAVSFKLRHRSMVRLELFDLRGTPVAILIDNQSTEAGKHIVSIDSGQLGLHTGVYYAVLTVDGKVSKRMVVKM